MRTRATEKTFPVKQESIMERGSGVDHDDDLRAIAAWRNRSLEPPPPVAAGAMERSRSASSQPVELSAEAYRVWKEEQEELAKTPPQNPVSPRSMANVDSIEVDELSTVIAKRETEQRISELGLGPVDLDMSGEALDAIVMALNEKEKSRSEEDISMGAAQTITPPSSSDRNKRARKPRGSPSPTRITPSGRDSPRQSARSSPTGGSRLRSPDSGESQPQSRKSPKQGSPRLRDQSQNFPDSLSDVPSNIDSETKDRYLTACRLLKSAMIEKETTLMPTEKDFLKGLLDDSEGARSEANLKSIVTASNTLLSDPLFQMDYRPPPASSLDAAKAAWQLKVEKERANNMQMGRSKTETPAMTPATHNKTPERKKARAPDRETNMSPQRMPPSRNKSDYPFLILGIEDVRPGVLTPPLMEAMRGFFPYAIAEENFLLKFSLERDGANLSSLLSKVRTSVYTIMSVETKDGHVFGAFCSSPWRVRPSWYGSGESFLWRLKNSRIPPGTKERNYDYDNEMEVYPFTGNDELVQYCTKRTIAVGGGDWGDHLVSPYEGEPTGIGFMIDGDLMGGETNSCATFANPRLCGRASKGNEFDIVNLELWTVTPCISEPEAEMLEMRRLFVEENVR